MTPQTFYNAIVVPAGRLMPEHDTPEARVLLTAIAGQESGWSERIQTPVGYARGYWQCERGGAVTAVVTSDTTKDKLAAFCRAIDVPPGIDTVYEAIAWNDTLACFLARLNLLLDPPALPALGDQDGAWECYLRVWRPGTPRPESWPARYQTALAIAVPVAVTVAGA